jgi:hypothetical protein
MELLPFHVVFMVIFCILEFIEICASSLVRHLLFFFLISQGVFTNVLMKDEPPENFALRAVQEAIKPQVMI